MPDPELLEFAKRRVEEFRFVGLVERFEESVAQLMQSLGWDPPDSIPRLNQAPRRAQDYEISDEAHDEMLRLTEVDRALYEHLAESAESRLAAPARSAESRG